LHGLTRQLALLLLAGVAPPATPGLEVRLRVHTPTLPPAAEIVVVGHDADHVQTAHPLRDRLVIPEAREDVWVTCRGEGLWCPSVQPVSGVVRLAVFGTMLVTAELAGPGASWGVAEGTVQGVIEGDPRDQPIEFRERLAVRDGEITFVAPSTSLDLRFAFPGCAPVYRWGVEPSDGDEPVRSVNVGKIRLHPGPSLSGWVRRQEDDLPIAGATVTLAPISTALQLAPLRRWHGSSDERGFFQIHGLAPGTYRLEASADGRVPRVLDAVDLEEAAETVVGTIALTPPIQVKVQLDPPRHPAGEAWTVSMRPVRASPHQRPLTVAANESGIAVISGLHPSEYYLQVSSQDGESLLTETREIVADEWLNLRVPVVAVHGRIELGGEPLEATVTLETGAGDKVVLASDEDGEISGWMRRPDRAWLMATVRWNEAIWQRERTLEVLPSIGEDTMELEIEVPAGTVYGEVTDAEGRSRPGYPVVAWPAGARSRLTEIRGETDQNGRFHLPGLEDTTYSIQAGGNGLPTSEVVAVDLSSGSLTSDVRLVVWPTRILAIAVTMDGEGVGGASVSLDGFGRIPIGEKQNTDGQGRARFEVPEALDRAVITVAAPYRLLWSGCVPIIDDELALALPTLPTGTVALRLWGRDDLPPATHGRAVLLTGDGGFIEYESFVHWNRIRNGEKSSYRDEARMVQTLQLPGMAPQGYGITWSGAPSWEIAARTCAGAFSDVEWVMLAPGGEAELTFDVSAVQELRLERLTQDRSR